MSKITELLGDKQEYYLEHVCTTIDKHLIHAPSPHFIDEVWVPSDRSIPFISTDVWPVPVIFPSYRWIRG